MKCRVCGYEGEPGGIDITSSDGYGSLVGRLPNPKGPVGRVKINVCTNCGSLSSDMNGNVKNPQ